MPFRDRPSDRRLKRVVAAVTVGALTLLVVLRAADLWWWRAQILDVNARDAMPGGGLLSIATACAVVDAQEAYSELDDLAPGRYVTVAVTDSGVGIPPEDIAHVFELFFTTKAVGAGTGLGLSMVYGLVKQSGGHVKVDSEIDRGTTVTLFFPQSPSG
jgi:signal transduction histidine kinase